MDSGVPHFDLDEVLRVKRCLASAKARCTNPKVPNYANYGGRGIRVSPLLVGEAGARRLLGEIGPRPTPGHTLDRIDNNGNYELGNLRWATRETQRANRRDSADSEKIANDSLDHTEKVPIETDTTRLAQWTARWPPEPREI